MEPHEYAERVRDKLVELHKTPLLPSTTAKQQRELDILMIIEDAFKEAKTEWQDS